jgi:hypothetical protein
MKNIILALLFAISLISCTQNESVNNPKNTDVLVLGKWNLISDTYGTINNPTEEITTCQSALWQFDFKNSKEMIVRTTSDDPSLEISQCNPVLLGYTYSINNDLIIMTPINSEYSAFAGYIKSLSSTQLVISSEKDELNKYRIFTFKKQIN